MMKRRRLCSFLAFFLLALLLFSSFSPLYADSPKINGSAQMSAGGTQTLTVSGGSGPYTWKITGGGGSLSGSSGTSLTYTAPATNPNCTNNATITVSCPAGSAAIQIAINTSGSNANAYATLQPGTCETIAAGTYTCIKCVGKYNIYRCDGGQPASYPCIDDLGGAYKIYCWDTANGVPVSCTACYNNTSGCDLYGMKVGVVRDLRTEAMKNAGCCPAQLLPPLPTPPPPPACDLSISNFKASSAVIDRNGGSISFSGGIASSQPFTWTLTIDGEVIGRGSGSSVAASWNIKDKFGKLKDPQKITATLSAAATGDSTCFASAEASFTIRAKDDDCTRLEITAESAINIASGNLSHTQTLFTVPNSRLLSDFTLSYNSTDSYNGVLATGWTHNYNLTLNYDSAQDTYVLMTGSGGSISLYKNGTDYNSDLALYPALRKNPDDTLTLTYKSGTSYTFNAAGRLKDISDKNGHTINLLYNAGNNLITITDYTGKTITLDYDAQNRLRMITDPNSNHYYFTYSGSTLIGVASENTLGTQTWNYTYDSNGFMLTKTDPQGSLVQYSYDAEHRVRQTTDPQGQIRTLQYDPVSNTATVIEKDGGSWIYQYNPILGALTARTDPQGNAIAYQYDSQRNLVTRTEADGSATSYTYDSYGNTTSVTDALGNTTTYTYNEQNLVTGSTDAAGKTTLYAYDSKGNLTAATDPAGATTRYVYDPYGNITRITSPSGAVTTMAYDQDHNLISITDPAGATTTQTYDNLGNMISQTDALGHKTTFQYNSLNQLIAVTDAAGNITRYSYDAHGNKLMVTDANGQTTRYIYNYRDQLIQTIDALGNVTTFAYGSSSCPSCGGNDKLTAVTDAQGRTTSYQYDQSGNLLKETDPLGKITSYTYNAKGNLIAKTKPDGRTITYIYDTLNRLLERKYPNNTADVFQYDRVGNVIKATTNQNIAYYYSYDANNRITGITDSHLRNIEYQYDMMGNRTMMTTPEGKTIKYSYNANNQLTKIETDRGSYTFAYDALNRRIKRTLPNNTITTYSYNQLSNLTKISHQNPFNKTIDSFSYTYDQVGNRLTKTDADKTINYEYDRIYRLTRAKPVHRHSKAWLPPGISKQQTESYSYDPVGNRQTGPTPNQSYTYNAGNELLQAKMEFKNHSLYNYEYDQNGNLVRKTQTSRHGHHQIITTYAYDDENRLTEVKIQQGHKAREISYTYDPFGRRISKTVHHSHTPFFGSDLADDDPKDNDSDKDRDKDKNRHRHKGYPQTTYYLYDDQNIIAEYDQRGKLIASYLHGSNIDEPLAVEKYQDLLYYHADGLGSITALTNHRGHTVQKYEYDSFGNMKHNQRQWLTQPYTYTGREADYETGLYYYRARYYDSKVGRFITKDPIGFEGGDVNLYAYVLNNPVNLNDPEGLEVMLCKRPAFGIIKKRPHCYIVVNGQVYSWHTKSFGGINNKENPKKDSCNSIKCCNIDKFEKCVEARIKMDIGQEGTYWNPVFGSIPQYDCCIWANSIINLCYGAAGCGN